MAPDLLLWAARWVHIGGCLLLAGVSAFPLYAGPIPAATRRWLVPLAVATLLSGLVWAALAVVTALDGSVSPAGAAAVLLQTGFGRVWCARLALAAALVVLVARGRDSRSLPWLAAALLAGLAGLGHATVSVGLVGDLRLTLRATHLVAAGVWLGGLIPLSDRLAENGTDAAPSVGRFSRVAVWSVGIVLFTGGAEILFAVIGVHLNPVWVGVLAAKLILIVCALAIALANRTLFAPGLEGLEAADSLRSLRRAVLAEQLLLAAAVAAVAVLGAISPTTGMAMS